MSKHHIPKDGFTIIELIVAGAISAAVIALGYSVVQMTVKGNKVQEASQVLSGKVEDTLDLILDEVNRGQRIVDTVAEVKSKNSKC